MSVLTAGGAAGTAARRRFAAYAWGVLAFNILVVLWGAYVRASGSGAGCGSHWPLCNGEVMPRSPALATIIEFTHRITSGLALALVAGLVAWAFRAFPKRHPARLGAVLSMAFIVSEALIGAGLVLFEHVAKNASTARAWSLSAHLVNTLTLLACITLTAWWASGGAPVRVRGAAAWSALASLAVLVLLGVSGALAALGDTLFPARSLAAGLRQDFSPAVHLFVRLRLLHPFLAAAAGSWLLFYAAGQALRQPQAPVRLLAWFVTAAVIGQLLAGVANVLLLAPVWMQIVHLLLADVLWIGLVLLSARRLSAESGEF
jgi:heme A synthase